jgi:type VI secretion system protein ImpA
MSIPLEKLLAPISADTACGEDVSYDPGFQELDTLILGKPETQFSAAEPPEWPEVRDRCLDLLGRSKHLRVIVTLAASLLRSDGLPGFRDGVALLEGVIGKYWEPLYPRLDPEDSNDPTERVNIIASLGTPLSVIGDPYKIVEGLRTAPLSSSTQMGRFSLQDVAWSISGAEIAGKPAPSVAQVDASFLDTRPEILEGLHASVTETVALIKSISKTLSGFIDSDRLPNFDALAETLRELQKLLAGRLPAKEGAGPQGAADSLDSLLGETAGAGATASPAAAARPRAAGLSGGIESREDVVRALDLICAYYSRSEPSSPIPLMLERAKRLVPMDFLAIVQDFAPDALGQVNLIAGIK